MKNELEAMEICGIAKRFRVILMSSAEGAFLCIPTHNVGLYTEEISNTTSLKEHLKERPGKKDAITIAMAVCIFEDQLDLYGEKRRESNRNFTLAILYDGTIFPNKKS